MLDDINSDEYTDDERKKIKTGKMKKKCIMIQIFKKLFLLFWELNEFKNHLASVKNPYFALNAPQGFLFNFNLDFIF